MMLLALLLACPPKDEPDPAEACRELDLECCGDEDCGGGEICHYVYTCVTRNGARDCSEPVGTNRCHELCPEGDTGGFLCASPREECQVVDHVQGGDSVEQIEACF